MKGSRVLSIRSVYMPGLFQGIVAPNIGWFQGSINGGLHGSVTDSTGVPIPGIDRKLNSLITGTVHA
ncbi:MAG: hypothetical protein ABI209_01205 [Edaphobacter sp.]